MEQPWRVASQKWQVCEAMISIAKLPETEAAVQWPSRDVWRAEASRRGAKRRTTLTVQHQPGRPRCTLTTNRAAHTIPFRLSTVSGEMMNRFADCENRNGGDEWQKDSPESEVRGRGVEGG